MTTHRITYLTCDTEGCDNLWDGASLTEKQALDRSGWRRLPGGRHQCVDCQTPEYRALRARRVARNARYEEWAQIHFGDPWEAIPLTFIVESEAARAK